MDFTLNKYSELLQALKTSGKDFVLRHDVDLKPENSLATARMESQLGLQATYYFRAVPESWNESIIKEISALGHEIGYHYECLTTCNGNMELAWEDFRQNLHKLRELVPVSKICMHGSPRSRWDSKDLWKKYDYRSQGIDYEPYLDTDYTNALYLTDTGRRWDGWKVSVRDKIPQWQEKWQELGLVFHTTDDIINRLQSNSIPQHISTIHITTHPQRWTNSPIPWFQEFILQNLKNLIKAVIVIRHK